MKITSIKILDNFLEINNIKLNPSKFLKHKIDNSTNVKDLPEDIVESIIFDAYNSSSKILKRLVGRIEDKYDILIGRLLKNLLKKYIDFRFDEDLNNFFDYFKKFSNDVKENELEGIIKDVFISIEYNLARSNSLDNFLINLIKSIEDDNETRIYDYLNFLYSRLLNFNELNIISLKGLFQENEEIINKEFDRLELKTLKDFCDNANLGKRELIVNQFNKSYNEILEKRYLYEQKVSTAILNITDDLFREFPNKEEFYSYLFSLIRYLYSIIRNHRILAIKIENIISNDINIKWEIFAYLSIFSEKFIKQPEKRGYYKPEEVFKDSIRFLYNLDLKDEEFEQIRKFYKNKIQFKHLNNLSISHIENVNELLDDFRNIYTGFTFDDCYILRKNHKKDNTHELDFIKNLNEILIIFSKHKFNDSKIPCPICGSLKISGNSYPKVGIKSWECKNPLCGERSKTNRGKRYSERTIFMQDSIYDLTTENLISRNMIKKWRKDVVDIEKEDDIYKMLIKYYSYKDDSILVINSNELDIELIKNLKKFSEIEARDLKFLSTSQFETNHIKADIDLKLFDEFFNSRHFNYINHFITNSFIVDDIKIQDERKIEIFCSEKRKIKLIQGDCFKTMQKFNRNSIDCMVTSPPYYNARDYSQWANLYSYLNEMYKIILVSNIILKPGGVFVFNVGDIYGNPNTTVKSKMGEKRIPLGSYIMYLFLKAGFELLENFIWNKGEPQSQRHKNDGIFTPFYQKPTNCYEHIIIFKKKGAPLKKSQNPDEIPWKTNIPKFSPVIKIDSNGENRYGHSAPFPPDIPEFACKCFTYENDILLDPFSGSLTSALEAIKNKRIGVGIEILEEYIDLSYKRANDNNIEIELFKNSPDEFKKIKKDKYQFKKLEMNKNAKSRNKNQNSLDIYL